MPSFNDITAGSSADSSCIQQVVDALKGTAGKGVPISITAVNDAANFALDVMNLDAVNQRGLRVRNAGAAVQLQVDVNGPQADPGGGLSPILTAASPSTVTNKTLTNSAMSLLAASSNTVKVPSARVTNTSTQTVSSGGATALTFNTERWDNDSIHSTAVTPTRLIASRAGLWEAGGSVVLDIKAGGSTASNVYVALRLNGTSDIVRTGGPVGSTLVGTLYNFNPNSPTQLGVGDYLELTVTTDTIGFGTSTSVLSGCEFWMTYRGTT